MRPWSLIGLVMCALCLPAMRLAAQEWHLVTEAGRIRSSLDPQAATPSVSLALRYQGAGTGFRVSGGIPTKSDEALWGSLGASRQPAWRAGSVVAGVDLLANAFALFDRGSPSLPVPQPFDPPGAAPRRRDGYALAGQALPMVGYEGARLQARIRGGLSRYASRIGDASHDRTVSLADAHITFLPTGAMALSPVVQHYRAGGESPVTFAGLSAIAASSSGSVWGMAGSWTGAPRGMQWSAGARLVLHPNLSLEGAARRTVHDPLYLQPPQTSWSAGVSWLIGRARVVAPPVPAAYRNGLALLRLPASATSSPPSIAGDFNDWTPARMQRDGDHWTFTVALKPGVYHYAFVTAAGEWFVPKGVAGRKDDGMGGHVAVLVVR